MDEPTIVVRVKQTMRQEELSRATGCAKVLAMYSQAQQGSDSLVKRRAGGRWPGIAVPTAVGPLPAN
jgi:hypothetical protein